MFASEIPLALPSSPFITAAAITQSPLAIAWCEFNQQAWHSDLHQQWQLPLPIALQNVVTKRKAEHLASRWLAQQMLSRFAMPDFVLRNAPDRSPLWPVGIQASLSHSQQMAVIAATREPLCIGVDVEQVMKEQTAEETAEMLMSSAERQRLASETLPFAAAATLLFSLKESVYKALWPQLHQPMDFLQAELLEWDLARGRATLTLTQDFSREFNARTRLQAHFWRRGDRVITLIAHPLNNP
ncbi:MULTISPECIES: 4'-phosphopantetheinyl transferase family protein [unclassified Pantoea]|uniref:4'-phosphopantetheinyl transferase family protein n=1 Tax=unclassified Pantoea TaxID=2630326 RepID=UPI001CD3C0EA|nr:MULTISPECIES: 4'-phosphopantetheinyl transferase superfamily protein [unclassified Pantoea]MCA1176096.1 4'-phosphopantetheinyl transferase superfamily protein [Pantoea sp. alder69]MCA1249067.1 4'-phosphopantetheinyl transferase superfamily protein [Pantoea sp. alder70]MCA1264858.1 4'-phosphopantetheinyl transferase superfamily protein [Pantoea sp. alder81]